MLLSKGTVKLRSLGLLPSVLVLTAGLAGAGTSGCFFIDEDDHGGGHDDGYYDGDDGDDQASPPDDQVPPDEEIPAVPSYAIQADQVFEAKPGEGVGIFVEYQSGGKWHVFTTCDTFVSKEICSFDIFAGARSAAELRAYATDEVEGFDELKDLGDGTVELIADTDSDTDGLVLELDAGTPLRLEVYLDGQAAQSFVYWVSDDAVHAGVPENPVQFVPVTP